MSYDPKIDPQIVQMLEGGRKAGFKNVSTLSVAEAREQHLAITAIRDAVKTRIGYVEDMSIDAGDHEVPVRIYKPYEYQQLGALPALLYFHGGGHTIGDIETHDQIVRNLCMLTDCVCISVDYRMGPEHVYPAASDDSYTALKWASENADTLGIDINRIAVGGDSAGGNLAAVIALMARENGGPEICFQLLLYPMLDLTCASQSHKRYSRGYGVLDTATYNWFREHYFPDKSTWTDWQASPLFADSHANLPPALVLLAELDLLHDEGVDYHHKLQASGVSSELKVYPGMIHAFFNATHMVDGACAAQAYSARALRKAFRTI